MFAEEFAAPVSEIFKKINETGYWPTQWKTEHLTLIPKKHNPVDLSECMNVSFTSAFLNILDNQVLLHLRQKL